MLQSKWKLLPALICILSLCRQTSYCQTLRPGCQLLDPIVNIDFGSSVTRAFLMTSVSNYKSVSHGCPTDGHFSVVAESGDCFGGKWHSLYHDHSPGDKQGLMMIVNASEEPGQFFILKIDGLKPGSSYQLGAWLVNICLSGSGCNPTPPSLSFDVYSNGILIKKLLTGNMQPTLEPTWKQYKGMFYMPPNATSITLVIQDLTTGGCGNDFAMDDITIRECKSPEPITEKQEIVNTVKEKVEPKPSPVKPLPVEQLTAIRQRKQQRVEPPVSNTATPTKIISATNRDFHKEIPLPPALATRKNEVVKILETAPGELLIELYDNGQIDGDTVTIYHNNELLAKAAGLSEKPLRFKVLVDAAHPHHEFVMVAENLGSIPPNTSLMIVTSASNRHEVFISSSEHKNAKIIIDLKK